MAKIKVKKGSKDTNKEPKTITIKKPQIKLSKIKFKKTDFKSLLTNKSFKVFLMVLVGVLAFGLVDFFFQYLNNDYSVAVVDGSRISTSEYHNRLEKQYGQTVAQSLIDEKLINLEAEKANIEVTEDEIKGKLDEIIESVGGQDAYDSALVANNITEEELKDQIKLDLISTKILTPTLEYTDDDVKAFFEQYSASIFPTETATLEEGEKLDFELYKDQVEEIYIQQQVQNEQYTWLSSLYSEYNIQNNSEAKPKYGFFTATVNIITNLLDQANSNETEETTEVVE